MREVGRKTSLQQAGITSEFHLIFKDFVFCSISSSLPFPSTMRSFGLEKGPKAIVGSTREV